MQKTLSFASIPSFYHNSESEGFDEFSRSNVGDDDDDSQLDNTSANGNDNGYGNGNGNGNGNGYGNKINMNMTVKPKTFHRLWYNGKLDEVMNMLRQGIDIDRKDKVFAYL